MRYYIINEDTHAILPYLDIYSIIYERNEIKIIKRSPQSIINFNCLINGSTYDGRHKGSSKILGCSYKSPISIKDNLIFFPTSSPRLKKCSWINLNSINLIDSYKDKKSSTITFDNNLKLLFHVSTTIINNQYLKALLLNNKLNKKTGQFM